jgi:hypothetical protein
MPWFSSVQADTALSKPSLLKETSHISLPWLPRRPQRPAALRPSNGQTYPGVTIAMLSKPGPHHAATAVGTVPRRGPTPPCSPKEPETDSEHHLPGRWWCTVRRQASGSPASAQHDDWDSVAFLFFWEAFIFLSQACFLFGSFDCCSTLDTDYVPSLLLASSTWD